MFTKRTIRPERTVTSVDTPSEALAVSIGEHGKVDLPYMAELLGTPGDYGRITTELSGVIFKDPAADPTDPEAGWQMADEYLSGNARDKLRMAQFAAESHPEFKVNVDALTKAQPKDLEASEIDVRLGATWLAPSIVQQFMMDTFQPPIVSATTMPSPFATPLTLPNGGSLQKSPRITKIFCKNWNSRVMRSSVENTPPSRAHGKNGSYASKHWGLGTARMNCKR